MFVQKYINLVYTFNIICLRQSLAIITKYNSQPKEEINRIKHKNKSSKINEKILAIYN